MNNLNNNNKGNNMNTTTINNNKGNKMNNSKRKSQGFTLIEFIVVLVAIGALTAVISRYASSAGEEAIADEESKQGNKVSQCVKDTRTAATYAGLNTEILIATGCLNGLNMLNADGDAIINNYGGAITVEPVALNGIDDLAVLVTSTGYSSEQCVTAVERRITTAEIVSVDGAEIKAQGVESVLLGDITTGCASEDLIELTWVVTR
jgi:prepilin-type N-terminal cleavage/methylation domain-containing protein